MSEHPNGTISVESEITKQLTIHRNLGQEIVVTTVDKIRLCLIENRDCLATKREWVLPFSLMVTFGTTLVAADFHDFFLPQAVWTALYVLLGLSSLVWFSVSGFRAFQMRQRGGIEELVERMTAKVRVGGESPH